ncbi:MAG: YfhO family protein, partial [Gloeobacteraceae cyanobacterium ES-bin-316]|nr:YfhO family protein [Ferruginibacter sp.]
ALATVLENSLNPASTVSLLSPFSTTANESWLESSILMRSIYLGIVPLLFLIYAFFDERLRKNRELRFFFVCAVVCLGMAWGSFFFLRQIAYYSLPLMNSFRHPALFRLFTIFFSLLIAASAFKSWEVNKKMHTRTLRNIIFSLISIVAIIGISCFLKIPDFAAYKWDRSAGLKSILTDLTFPERYLLQFPFLLGILLLSLFAVVKKKSIYFICLLVVADLFLATQLNMPVTVFGAKPFTTVEQLIHKNPIRFPLPGNQTIEQNSLNSLDENFLTGSRIPYSKKIGRNDYFITPGNLSKQEAFYNSPIKDLVFKNGALYFPDSIFLLTQSFNKTLSRIAFKKENEIIPQPGEAHMQDKIEITGFSANSVQAAITRKNPGLLVYLQNNYEGWVAFIDGKPAELLPVNITFMAIAVPAGEHLIEFKYRPLYIIISWYISIVSLFILLGVCSYLFFSKSRSGKHQKENAAC